MMRTTVVKSPCWLARSAIRYRRKPCSACGNGERASPSVPVCTPAPIWFAHFSATKAQVQSSFDQPMRKAALLYNPDSGGSKKRRQTELESVVAMLRSAGVDASLILTHSSAHAEEQARQAVLAGCDT